MNLALPINITQKEVKGMIGGVRGLFDKHLLWKEDTNNQQRMPYS